MTAPPTSTVLAHAIDRSLAADSHAADAETVLLLNGGMMTHPSWAPLCSELIDRYHVVRCDFRGQLLSPGPGHPGFEGHVGDVVALLDHLGLGQVHVLGASFGGEVGLLLTARHPERVRTLAAVTAVDQTPPAMPESSRQLQQLIREGLAGENFEGFLTDFNQRLIEDLYSPSYRQHHASEIATRLDRTRALPRTWFQDLLGILRVIEDFDLTPWLGSIRCPVLVAHAACDTVMPEHRVNALAQAIAGAELHVHPAAGHALILEDLEWLVDRYRDFLARRGAGN